MSETLTGRELDAAVERVIFEDAHWEQGHNPYRNCPHYSTTWEGAGLVVERLREDGWLAKMVQCSGVLDDLGRIGWEAEFRSPWDDRPNVYGRAETAPEAICRAALASAALAATETGG